MSLALYLFPMGLEIPGRQIKERSKTFTGKSTFLSTTNIPVITKQRMPMNLSARNLLQIIKCSDRDVHTPLFTSLHTLYVRSTGVDIKNN